MEIKITFRHLSVEPEFKEYAESGFQKLVRYIHRPVSAQAIFSKEKNRYIIELNVLADSNQFFAREQDDNFYLAFDQALSKLESQIKRFRDRLKPNKQKRGKKLGLAVREEEPDEILKSEEFYIPKPVSIEEAVFYLESMDAPFVVFRHAGNEKIRVLYKRRDGNLGLIEPE